VSFFGSQVQRSKGYGFGARSRIAVEARAADRALRVSGMQHPPRKPWWHTSIQVRDGGRAQARALKLPPNAEITAFPWREPPELLAGTINRVLTFLRAHQPMRAVAQKGPDRGPSVVPCFALAASIVWHAPHPGYGDRRAAAPRNQRR